MPGNTDNIGTAKAVGGLHKNRSLDFSDEFPGMHLVIVDKKHQMYGGYTTQYDYFLGEGLTVLKELPNPNKVLMGEPMEQYKARKQVAIDLHKANVRMTGVKEDKEAGIQRTVRTEFGSEE